MGKYGWIFDGGCASVWGAARFAEDFFPSRAWGLLLLGVPAQGVPPSQGVPLPAKSIAGVAGLLLFATLVVLAVCWVIGSLVRKRVARGEAPRWAQYRSDRFMGVDWTWTYGDGYRIDRLVCLCPACGKELPVVEWRCVDCNFSEDIDDYFPYADRIAGVSKREVRYRLDREVYRKIHRGTYREALKENGPALESAGA